MVMDFEALMLKKLGGSKQLPQPTPGPQATSGTQPTSGSQPTPGPQSTPRPASSPGPQPTTGQNLAMEVGESAVGLDVGGGIIPPPQVKQKSRKSLKTPQATLKPRVK